MAIANQNVQIVKDSHLFIHTRARLQRTDDMKFFNGWVESMNQVRARITLKGPMTSVRRGQRFSVEIAGKESTALFLGDVLSIRDHTIDLMLVRPLSFSQKKENVRIRMTGELCHLTFEERNYEAKTVDISDGGLGLILPTELPFDVTVEFDLCSPVGNIAGMGVVVYCKVDAESPAFFRAGMRIGELDRLGQARWRLLLNAASSIR